MSDDLICLVMIVKDEAAGIARTLASVRDHVDRWCILDTGSTDSTPATIEKAMAGIPGRLYHEPFVDFASSRNRVLDLTADACAFTLMLSGDEIVEGGEALRAFADGQVCGAAAAYYLQVAFGRDGVVYDSPRLARTSSGWRYAGRAHEVLVGNRGASGGRVPGCRVVHDKSPDSARDAARWEADLVLLRADAAERPGDPRVWFYLAQTLHCLWRYGEAELAYAHRIAMNGGWREETFVAMCRRAECLAATGRWPEAYDGYMAAAAYYPGRAAEPLHEIALHAYREKDWETCHRFARRGSEVTFPADARLFVRGDVYAWRLWDLWAVSAWNLGWYGEADRAAALALAACPDDPRLADNLQKIRHQWENGAA